MSMSGSAPGSNENGSKTASAGAGEGFIDLHAHYLPAVDDGAADLGATVDMVKGVDPAAVIDEVCVVEKTGGKTGHWSRP